MTTRDYTQEILEQVHKLDADKQRRVLEFVRSLTHPRGEPGSKLIADIRRLNFSPEDVAEMAEAIKDCERIDWDEWDIPA